MQLTEEQLEILLIKLRDKDELYTVPLEMVEIIQDVIDDEETKLAIQEMKPKMAQDFMNAPFGQHNYTDYPNDVCIEILTSTFDAIYSYINSNLIKS